MFMDPASRIIPDRLPLTCQACPARLHCPCGASRGETVAQLGRSSSHISFRPGQTILKRGDAPGTVMTVQSGVVAARATTADGREQVCWLYFAGDTIGHPHARPSAHDLTAITPVTFCSTRREDYHQAIENDAGFRGQFIDAALQNFEAAQTWMMTLGRKTARERVASFLYLLLAHGKRNLTNINGTLELSLPMSRGDIATFLGMSVETVSRGLSALRDEKIITTSGRHVRVHDAARLQEATGDIHGHGV